jgi:hypothetical protein
MSEELFSEKDRESLIGWMESRGGNREQAEFAARQLMKRAAMVAEKEGIAPIEAMGQLLSKVAEAERIVSDNLGDPGKVSPPDSSPKSP